MANLLKAIHYLVENSIADLETPLPGKNKINDMGGSLESFIKNLLAGTLDEADKSERVKIHSEVFSYIGNQNNPPDLIIRNSDAIEVKKIESFGSGIHFDFAYPKSKLSADDPRIIDSCRSVDGGSWESKDLIYAIGVVIESKLKRLWLIVGDCLIADDLIYERIRDEIIVEIDKIRDIKFSRARELDSKVNQLSREGITYLRISGAWGISNPANIYDYLGINYNENANLQLIAIMTADKYHSFPEEDINSISKTRDSTSLEIKNVRIKSPSNLDDFINAKLITYQN